MIGNCASLCTSLSEVHEMTSTTVTIRVDPEVKDKLDRLARDTRRSRSYLAAEAVAAYVDRELEIISYMAPAQLRINRLRQPSYPVCPPPVNTVSTITT